MVSVTHQYLHREILGMVLYHPDNMLYVSFSPYSNPTFVALPERRKIETPASQIPAYPSTRLEKSELDIRHQRKQLFNLLK